ncbi:DUF6350 family protein [Bifidobacterium stellenboschense]|uniref:Lipoprotein n=1 Tax=Bifidobacterium stellenboschense TaxID=762211 RepID=A0A087DPP2_9BIFI|nr:DUF6350 family protein [Bifidobacterium stellenboschense]KFI97492.1 hypothetical protein BSTEL_0213 [Bifidobacterium stellenboschense]
MNRPVVTSKRISALLKGGLTALGAMALYAVSLGCFIALMLLVISMEEGGESLPSSALPLTETIVLLSQGTGFTAGSIVVGVMPLLLTLLLVALVAQCASRADAGALGWVSGLVVWVALNLMLSGGTGVELHDTPAVIAAKTACVWTIGYAFAAVPGSSVMANVRSRLNERISPRARRMATLVGAVTGMLSAVFLVTALIVTIVWVVRGWSAMTALFEYDGMENGSRILTTISSLAWLPNLAVWALSWVAGAGFHIGELGSFTMWVGQSAGLPPLPVFGLMPEAIADDRVRIVLQCLIPAFASVIALLVMLVPGPMRVRPVRPADGSDAAKHAVVTMACHLVVLVLAGIVTVGVWCGCFALSDGALGAHRLSHVGVDIPQSTLLVARSIAFGFGAAWLAVAVVLSAVYGIHWIVGRHAARVAQTASETVERVSSSSDGDADHAVPAAPGDEEPKARDDDASARGRGGAKPRSIRSERAVRSETFERTAAVRRAPRTVRSDKLDQPTKEESDDNNESSD